MTVERGIVETTEDGFAWVKTKRKDACAGCASRNHCAAVEGGSRMMVRVENAVGAQKGDAVELFLSTAVQLQCTFVAYMVPVLGLMAGALSSQWLAGVIGIRPAVATGVFTVAGFLAAVGLSRLWANRMVAANRITPKIRRIITAGRSVG